MESSEKPEVAAVGKDASSAGPATGGKDDDENRSSRLETVRKQNPSKSLEPIFLLRFHMLTSIPNRTLRG